MKQLSQYSKAELGELLQELQKEYATVKAGSRTLNMSRGKPCTEQLDLSVDMMSVLSSKDDFFTEDGTDCRNYGYLEGIPEARKLFGELLDVSPDNIIVGGNSSLNMMYDTIARAMTHGVAGGKKPWGKYEKIKFLCPAPGYDRHFAICEHFGIEMIPVAMTATGPDMDTVEALVSSDETIKGIWCVPVYSNPEGVVYSADTVRRFAALKPKADDFRIMWDNAYAFHHLTQEKCSIPNIITECEKAGNPKMVFEYTSTSKISFPGSGVAVMVACKENLDFIKKQLCIQTIGPDKLNQLRHVKFFINAQGVHEHMKKHAAILKPRFDLVADTLEKELVPLGICTFLRPKGGYFISFNSMVGCAKRIVKLLDDAGVTVTNAGATFPYGNDPLDQNIRIAPTFPPLSELSAAMNAFCLCTKIASVEKLLSR